MKLNRILATAALAATCLAATAQQRKPMVVVISLDAYGSALLDQPLLATPTLHALMATGSYASMRPVNPTVTWPNHTSMVTGVAPAKHGVIANGLVTGQRTGGPIHAEFEAYKDVLVHVPTVYDAAHAAGLVTAEMDWVAIRNAKTIDYSFFEHPSTTQPLIREMITDKIITADQIENFRKTPQSAQDRLYTQAAVYAIKHHHPSLTLLHLLAMDDTEHHYGFDTEAGQVTAAFLDDRVKEVIDAVRDAGDLDRTTFLIVSDHGQSSVHHTVDTNASLKAAGITPQQAVAMNESGAVYIYETHASPELTEQIRKALAASPATDRVLSEEEATSDGFPTPHNPGMASLAPDVIAYAKEDWVFGDRDTTLPSAAGAHGYPNTRSLMQAIFIANGAAIKPLGQQPSFPNIDVAATIAQLLGLPQTNMDGKPLTAILK